MNIKLIYETQTGNTQYVAEVLQKELSAAGHTVQLHSVKTNGKSPEIQGMDVLVFGSPTYDDGYLEQDFNDFVTSFKPDLSTYKVAVFGLGDSSYPQFCTAAELLEKWVGENKGTLVIPPLRVDGFPDDTTPIVQWAKDLLTALQSAPAPTAAPAATPTPAPQPEVPPAAPPVAAPAPTMAAPTPAPAAQPTVTIEAPVDTDKPAT